MRNIYLLVIALIIFSTNYDWKMVILENKGNIIGKRFKISEIAEYEEIQINACITA